MQGVIAITRHETNKILMERTVTTQSNRRAVKPARCGVSLFRNGFTLEN